MSIDANKLKKIYRKMLLLRRFEERAGQLYTKGEISGFCHLYIGQEALAVGMVEALAREDAITTSYRDHGIMLALDSDPNVIMAELCGRYSGCSKGKGGSMHMFDVGKGFYGGHGIVGAQVPIATGIAFAKKYQESNAISVAMMGDGAVNQGQVYEAFNMARLWNLPVLYIIENNGYAMGTSVARGCAGGKLSDRGISFGIPGEQVDAMNPVEVLNAVQKAVKSIRNGEGPRILEMLTYRYKGHSMSDPAKYRTKEELEEYKGRDPLLFTKHMLLERKFSDDAWFAEQEKEIKQIVMGSIDFALNSDLPPLHELEKDVYIEN